VSEPALAAPGSSLRGSSEHRIAQRHGYFTLSSSSDCSSWDSYRGFNPISFSSPPSGTAPSETGIETVRAEELEGEMVDELTPLFGKETGVICMDRARGVPSEFTWTFHLPKVHPDRVSQWAGAPGDLGCVGPYLTFLFEKCVDPLLICTPI